MWEGAGSTAVGPSPTMLMLYNNVIVPFAETLVRMERRGIALDRSYLSGQRALAEADRDAAIEIFREKLVQGIQLIDFVVKIIYFVV